MMIHFSADIVLAVRDGFTGKPIAQSALLCTLDGAPFRPLLKKGGYIVFTNIGEGEHSIVLSGARYVDEHLSVNVSEGQCVEKAVSMKPSAKYPFGKSVTRLTLAVKRSGAPARESEIWISVANPLYEIKIAQDSVASGEKVSRLFSRDKKILEQLPAAYLVYDGRSSEIVEIADLTEETGSFESPFGFAHKRGTVLFPAQKYTADASGVIEMVFGEPGSLMVFSLETATVKEIKLSEGKNEAELQL